MNRGSLYLLRRMGLGVVNGTAYIWAAKAAKIP